MKHNRAKRIPAQLIAEAYNGVFSTEKVLYLKEAKQLRADGFKVNRVFSDEFDHPERNSFLFAISWKDVNDEESFAKSLYDIANETIQSV